MYETAFDIVALAMRYWFVLIVAYILFRLVQNVLLEFSSERTAQKRAAGYALGLLEVVEPVGSSIHGRTFALKRENTIGSARKCDIRLQSNMIDALHAAIYQKGNKVFLSDYGTKRGVSLNGRRIRRDVPLFDGDEIAVGNVVLLLHISGIEPAKRGDSYYYEEEPEELDVTAALLGANAEVDDEREEADEDEEGDEAGYENGSEYEPDNTWNEFDPDDDENEDGDEDGDEDEPREAGEDAFGHPGDDRDDGLDIPQQDGRLSYRRSNIGKWSDYGDRRGQDDQW